MINEIKRRLEAGEKVELECIERSLFLNVNDGVVFDENLEILESGLVVDRVSRSTISLLDCPHPIMIDEIQYFKIKENKKTFHDLVDVAVQAGNDGVLTGIRIDFEGIRCLRVEYSSGEHVDQIFDYHEDYSEYVERIKSRYTETFVIEVEEDCFRIKQGAEITFTNGNSVIMDNPPTDDGIVRIWNDGRYDFTVLKGATVTQRKNKK